MTARFALGKLPNLLSSSRLVLAAGFVLSPGPDARVGIIGVAAVTDFLDGWVARRVHATSRWGALLDPFADRVFVLTAVATFLLSGMLTEREYFVLILRDLATAIGFLIARAIPRLSAVQFKARHLGKLVTVLQLLALTTVIVAPEAVPFVLAAVALVSLVSIADYAWALWSARAA